MPAASPAPTAEYPAVGFLTEQLGVELSYAHGQTAEATGHYADVGIDDRPPLMQSAEVRADLLRFSSGGRVPDLGDLQLEITLPNGGDITSPTYERERNHAEHTMYVFRKQGDAGPQYTIVGPSSLYRLASNEDVQNSTIVTMQPGDRPLVVGTGEGNWMPTVGYDVALLGHEQEQRGGRRTVSREQGAFYFSQDGSLHYAEPAHRLNASTLHMRKIAADQHADQQQYHATKAKDQELRTEAAAMRAAQPQEPGVHGVYHESAEEVRLEPADFARTMISSRTFGGRLVGEKYKGQHRRSNFLGRIAARLRSR